MSYKLGVIGGMGSEATSYYFEQLVLHTKASKDQEYIDTVILNNASLPDRTESILSNETDYLHRKLISNARILEDLGVDNIAIPCNTAHYFYDQLSENISMPIINMVRETIESITRKYSNLKKIGIMATDGTIKSKVYHKECQKLGIELVTPTKENQSEVMSLIYDEIKVGKSGDFSKFQGVYEELMGSGCEAVILACTELSVFKKKNKLYDNCIDAMDVLVKESIVRSGRHYLI